MSLLLDFPRTRRVHPRNARPGSRSLFELGRFPLSLQVAMATQQMGVRECERMHIVKLKSWTEVEYAVKCRRH